MAASFFCFTNSFSLSVAVWSHIFTFLFISFDAAYGLQKFQLIIIDELVLLHILLSNLQNLLCIIFDFRRFCRDLVHGISDYFNNCGLILHYIIKFRLDMSHILVFGSCYHHFNWSHCQIIKIWVFSFYFLYFIFYFISRIASYLRYVLLLSIIFNIFVVTKICRKYLLINC